MGRRVLGAPRRNRTFIAELSQTLPLRLTLHVMPRSASTRWNVSSCTGSLVGALCSKLVRMCTHVSIASSWAAHLKADAERIEQRFPDRLTVSHAGPAMVRATSVGTLAKHKSPPRMPRRGPSLRGGDEWPRAVTVGR